MTTSEPSDGRARPAPALAPHLRLATSPSADPANVLSGRHWRISVLDAGLVRLEWSPSGRFADLASQAILHRDLAPVDFTVRGGLDEQDAGNAGPHGPGSNGAGSDGAGSDSAGPHRPTSHSPVLEVITERFHLTYDRREFSAHGLTVTARGGISNYHSTWRFGIQAEGNLGGTARTLDRVDGRVELEDGLLSVHGLACYDDSRTALIDEDGWFAPREPGSLDLYLFVYGRDYTAALATFHRVSGAQPLLPRWALGSWWSRYHPYSSEQYRALLDRFAAEGLPFSVAVLDMDWHLVDIDPALGSGWTGYSWNTDLLPDPRELLRDLHSRGIRVAVNVHPADGIRAHESAYPAVAEAMGVDPSSRLPVAFDPTDTRFLATYFADVHHRLEEDGVDLFWLDWQQGRESRVAGLDPLWLLNHLHFHDAGRPGGPLQGRPMTFSRYAGIGSHRYPIGFSGDSVVSWDSLAFQPEFTSRAANVGYGWWSHDIGGHMWGAKDDELAARWVQLGCFSPILRLHSTLDEFNSKEPWRFGEQARAVMTRYLRLRHRLLPYLATMARRTHVEGRALVEPMYHRHPWADDAYGVANQFYFGTSLLVAPVTSPAERSTGLARVDVWLPEGEWVDLLTGLAYTGGRRVPMHRALSEIPVLARPGTVLPLDAEEIPGSSTAPADAIEIVVVAGADGCFELVEDRDDDRWATTHLTYTHATGELVISAVEGERATVGGERGWRVRLVGFEERNRVLVAGIEVETRTDATLPGLVADLGRHATDRSVSVCVHGSLELRGGDTRQAGYDLLDRAQIEYSAKRLAWQAISGLPADTAALALHSLGLAPEVLSALSELLLARSSTA